MIIESKGYHVEKLTGELFIGFFSEYHIKKFVTWKTKRMGDVIMDGPDTGKHPLFIWSVEAIGKGWTIH